MSMRSVPSYFRSFYLPACIHAYCFSNGWEFEVVARVPINFYWTDARSRRWCWIRLALKRNSGSAVHDRKHNLLNNEVVVVSVVSYQHQGKNIQDAALISSTLRCATRCASTACYEAIAFVSGLDNGCRWQSNGIPCNGSWISLVPVHPISKDRGSGCPGRKFLNHESIWGTYVREPAPPPMAPYAPSYRYYRIIPRCYNRWLMYTYSVGNHLLVVVPLKESLLWAELAQAGNNTASASHASSPLTATFLWIIGVGDFISANNQRPRRSIWDRLAPRAALRG